MLYQYINDELVGSTGPDSPWSGSGYGSGGYGPDEKHLVLGGDYYTDYSTYMRGGFDGLLIYEVPMSGAEVRAMYESYSVTQPVKYASSKVVYGSGSGSGSGNYSP